MIMRSQAPIFIIGSYRSGTSVLTWCLGQHPNILPLEETSWIAHLGVYLDHLYYLGTVNKNHSHLSSSGISEDGFYQYFGKSVNNFIAEHIESYMDGANGRSLESPELVTEHIQISRSGTDPKQRWIDGTPENSHYVYGLSKLFPEAKFIHILRNPKQVAHSLMHFSTVGQTDYPENEAYNTWMGLVRAAAEAERALGSEKVLRVYYADLIQNPKTLIKSCLDFIGEPYHEDCLRPLNKKINSSKYQQIDDDSVENNINSDKDYIREAFEQFRFILSEKPALSTDLDAQRSIKEKYFTYAMSLRPEEVDKISKWAVQLNQEIKEKDARILQLQGEVEKLGAWGKSLDKIIEERNYS